MLVLHLGDRFLAEYHEVLILLGLAADSVETGYVLVDLSVYECGKKALLDLLDTFHCLVEIVQIDHSDTE